MMFADRADAGRALAQRLAGTFGSNVVVLGLPRGGVVVAAEVARALGAPLDVIVVRKLGVPWQPELAMGAIGEDGVRVLEPSVSAQVGEAQIAAVERVEHAELTSRVARFRGERPMLPLTGRTALIVDDGIATGSTARAACRVARGHGAARVVLAVPVAPHGVERDFAGIADEVIALATPRSFGAVGSFYADFRQTTDAEVIRLLHG